MRQPSGLAAAYLPNAREIVSPDHVLPPLHPLDSIPLGLLFTHWLEERERQDLGRKFERFKGRVSTAVEPFQSAFYPQLQYRSKRQ